MLTTYLCVMHESTNPAEKSCVDELAGSLYCKCNLYRYTGIPSSSSSLSTSSIQWHCNLRHSIKTSTFSAQGIQTARPSSFSGLCLSFGAQEQFCIEEWLWTHIQSFLCSGSSSSSSTSSFQNSVLSSSISLQSSPWPAKNFLEVNLHEFKHRVILALSIYIHNRITYFIMCLVGWFARKLRQFHLFVFSPLRFQMCPQITFLKRGIVTLIALVWLFSIVCLQMCPQIACIIGCIITLIALFWLFSAVCFQMSPQIAGTR